MSRIELDDEGLDASWFPRPIYGTGRWYGAGGLRSTGGGGSQPTEGQLSVRRLWIPAARTLSGLAVQIGTGGTGSAGAVLRLGIFRSDSNGEPSSLILDAGTVDMTATAGTVQTITGLSTVLNPGLYWIGSVLQGGSATRPFVVQENAGTADVSDVQVYGPTDAIPTSVYTEIVGSYFATAGGAVTGALPTTVTWADTSRVSFPPAKMLWRFSA